MPDDIINSILLLLLTVVLIALNGFFVATEFAIVKVRSTRIKELMENGSVTAKLAHEGIKHLDAYLSATQIGITLASLGLGWIGEPLVHRFVAPLFTHIDWLPSDIVSAIPFVLAFCLITYFHIVFGEQAPKWLAIQRAEKIMLWVAGPMSVFFWLFRPFITIINGSARVALRPFGIQEASVHDLAHSEEELRMIITASGTDNGGTLRETQAELLDNVFAFGHRLARQIMRHRTEVEALDVEDALEANIRIAQEGGHTRYPVMQEDIDTILGFIHTKDLFALYQRDPQGDLRTIIRQTLLVPETIRVDMLLRQLQKKRQHMAVLVDEYGGTAGLVTITDLVEELVGEMPDEFEPAETDWVIRVDNQTWSIDGRLPLTDLEELLGRELSCEDECDTVGGYVYWTFGRIPAENDQAELDGIALRVLEMDGRRVSRVEIVLLAEGVETEDERSVLARGGR